MTAGAHNSVRPFRFLLLAFWIRRLGATATGSLASRAHAQAAEGSGSLGRSLGIAVEFDNHFVKGQRTDAVRLPIGQSGAPAVADESIWAVRFRGEFQEIISHRLLANAS